MYIFSNITEKNQNKNTFFEINLYLLNSKCFFKEIKLIFNLSLLKNSYPLFFKFNINIYIYFLINIKRKIGR